MGLRRESLRTLACIVLASSLSACQAGDAASTPASLASTPPATSAPPAGASGASESAGVIPANFPAWLDQLRTDARRKGVSSNTISQALADVAPIPRVLELDQRQPEYTQTFRRYLDGVTTDKRIANGKALMQQHAALLARLEKEHGVPGRFLVAFWGLESDFGRDIGGYPVVGSLATLAYDGRREAFFRDELFKALTILDAGHVTLAKMKGSWAGAMGQTQFMPSTFLRYGVDQDRDGHIDIWGSVPDALGSAANYLKSIGWNEGRTWGREVRLPNHFDVTLASLNVDANETVKPLAEWAKLGVRRADGGTLPSADIAAALILPDGIRGPAFLVYDNYRVILKFNRSVFYAVTIGHMADRFIGAGPLAAPRVLFDPLRRDEIAALQQGLATLGLFTATADGVIGPATRQAVRTFQKANGLPPDGYVDAKLIAAVRARAGA